MKNNHFAIIDNEYINLYCNDNPILSAGDECYFLFNNITDFHRPLLGRGIVADYRLIDNLTTFYYIKLIECLESPLIKYKFLSNADFKLHVYNNTTEIVTTFGKPIHIKPEFNFNDYCFYIPGFFVRKSKEKILELRLKYIEHIKKDNIQQTNDIEEMLNADIKI